MVRRDRRGTDIPNCVYCNQPIKASQEKFIISSITNQNIGILHGYCHPFVQDNFEAKLYTIKTSLGVKIKPKHTTTLDK